MAVSISVAVFRALTYNGVYLPEHLQLHIWILFEQQQHEEEADGQSVGRRDHHLQHTLHHVLSRQLAVVLKNTQPTVFKSNGTSLTQWRDDEYFYRTDLCKYELCGEVDVVEFIGLLHVSPLLPHKVRDGIVQLLAVR